MPAERLSMRKVREVLRLRYACGASERVIARSIGVGRTAIGEYIRRAAVIGITWPVPEDLDDTALERKLFAPAGYNPPRSKPLPAAFDRNGWPRSIGIPGRNRRNPHTVIRSLFSAFVHPPSSRRHGQGNQSRRVLDRGRTA